MKIFEKNSLGLQLSYILITGKEDSPLAVISLTSKLLAKTSQHRQCLWNAIEEEHRAICVACTTSSRFFFKSSVIIHKYSIGFSYGNIITYNY